MAVQYRAACGLRQTEQSNNHYRGCRADQADLQKRMEEIAETRVRYGYPLRRVLLRRVGWDRKAKRIYRLHKKMGLQLRHKPPKRRVKARLREGCHSASCSNEAWAMDSVHDQLATGPKLHIPPVIHTFRRFSPAVVPRFSFRSPDVVEVLERVCGEMGYPASIRADQAASSSRATWTCGPTPGAARWTSAGRTSRRTTRSSSRSTASSARSA